MIISLRSLLGVLIPFPAAAGVTADLSWVASPDAAVTGYDIYYGTASHQYTNMVGVGSVTHAAISDLRENTTYFFAAKARDGSGNESDFSNEAAFAGFHARPDAALRLRTMPANLASNSLAFSLGGDAPAGATINPTNGIFSWTPGRACASTTNFIAVTITNPADSGVISETLAIIVSDFLEIQVGATAVSAGATGSLPLTIAASSSVTDLQITLDWPSASLLNPTLVCAPPMVSGSLQTQGNQLLIQMQVAPEAALSGTNQIAQVNFEAAATPTSAVISVRAVAASGHATDGTVYANVLAQAGEVVVVGLQPLLRPQAAAAGHRSLSLFANPGHYQLLYSTSLAAPITWTPLFDYDQTNVAQTVSLDANEPVIFYRLQQF